MERDGKIQTCILDDKCAFLDRVACFYTPASVGGQEDLNLG